MYKISLLPCTFLRGVCHSDSKTLSRNKPCYFRPKHSCENDFSKETLTLKPASQSLMLRQAQTVIGIIRRKLRSSMFSDVLSTTEHGLSSSQQLEMSMCLETIRECDLCSSMRGRSEENSFM